MDWLEEVLVHEKQGDSLTAKREYREALGHYRAALSLCPGEAGTASIERTLEEKIRACKEALHGRRA